LISFAILVPLLQDYFFHKWLFTLYQWFLQSQCSPRCFLEMSDWYLEWKSLFSKPLLDHPFVQNQFTIALNMMNHVLNSGRVDDFADGNYAMPYPVEVKKDIGVDNRERNIFRLPAEKISFRDTVEFFALKNNLNFLPLKKVSLDGKQIFKFGNTQIYLDKNVVYAEIMGSFIPIAFEKLLELQGKE
jgi:hypothetical protein